MSWLNSCMWRRINLNTAIILLFLYIYHIYAYVERLGINSSLIHPHYELPIAMVASSGKKKSRQGITIRKNKQPVSTVESSSSHLNRTESSHSNNVRSASNMIPCFPANNSTMCISLWYSIKSFLAISFYKWYSS